jgi:hypothetical protein
VDDAGSGVVSAIEYNLNGAGGTISGTWTLSITDTYACAVAAFIPPGPAGNPFFTSDFPNPTLAKPLMVELRTIEQRPQLADPPLRPASVF